MYFLYQFVLFLVDFKNDYINERGKGEKNKIVKVFKINKILVLKIKLKVYSLVFQFVSKKRVCLFIKKKKLKRKLSRRLVCDVIVRI